MSNAQRRAAERHAKRSLGVHPGAGKSWPGFDLVAEANERFARLVELDKELTANEERERRALIVANGNPPVSGAERRRWKALRNAGHVVSPPRMLPQDVDFALQTFPGRQGDHNDH